eukprot:scpid98208/ scgid16107/ 
MGKGQGAHAKLPKFMWQLAMKNRSDLASGIPLAIALGACTSFLLGIGFHLAYNGTETNLWRSQRSLTNSSDSFNRYSSKTDNGLILDPTRSSAYNDPAGKPPKY